jgi:hypothetical protein
VSGFHPHALGPRDAEPIVREMRRLCRVRTRPASIEILSEPEVQKALIDDWRYATEDVSNRAMPRVTNSDGDPFSPTSDYFDIVTSDIDTLLSAIADIPGVEASEPRNKLPAFVITKANNAQSDEWNNTVIGTVLVDGKRLCLETSSTAHADKLSGLLSTHLEGLIRYRLREEMGSVQKFIENVKADAHNVERQDDPEVTRAMRDLRQQQMMGWVDESVPLLRGLTPREAVRTGRGKREVELLLRDFEHHEAMLPDDERIDIRRIRAKLGLD